MSNEELKALYEKLYNNFDKYVGIGICEKMDYMYRGGGDIDILHTHFNSQKPTIFSKFWWNRSYIGNKKIYWWTSDQKGIEQRKLFLKHIINKL